MFKNRFLFSGHSSAQIAEENRDEKVLIDCDTAESRTVDPRCQLQKEGLDIPDIEHRHLTPVQDSDLDEKPELDCSQDAEIIDPRCPVLEDPSKDQEGPKINLNCTDDDLLKLNPSCLSNSQSMANQDSHDC